MDMQYIQGGCRITPVVTDLLRRIEAAKDGYLRSASVRRTGDARRGDEAVSNLKHQFEAYVSNVADLVGSPNIPRLSQIASYFRRVASLAFEERPDYSSVSSPRLCPIHSYVTVLTKPSLLSVLFETSSTAVETPTDSVEAPGSNLLDELHALTSFQTACLDS